jgi:hypothetical protein
MMKMPGMLSCREVHRHAAMGTDADLGGWARLRFRLHLMMCHHCARYVRQVRALGDQARRLLGREPDPEHCRRLERAVMERWGGGGPAA